MIGDSSMRTRGGSGKHDSALTDIGSAVDSDDDTVDRRGIGGEHTCYGGMTVMYGTKLAVKVITIILVVRGVSLKGRQMGRESQWRTKAGGT